MFAKRKVMIMNQEYRTLKCVYIYIERERERERESIGIGQSVLSTYDISLLRWSDQSIWTN